MNATEKRIAELDSALELAEIRKTAAGRSNVERKLEELLEGRGLRKTDVKVDWQSRVVEGGIDLISGRDSDWILFTVEPVEGAAYELWEFTTRLFPEPECEERRVYAGTLTGCLCAALNEVRETLV